MPTAQRQHEIYLYKHWQGAWKLPGKVCHGRAENKVNMANSFSMKEVAYIFVFMTLRSMRNKQPLFTLYVAFA